MCFIVFCSDSMSYFHYAMFYKRRNDQILCLSPTLPGVWKQEYNYTHLINTGGTVCICDYCCMIYICIYISILCKYLVRICEHLFIFIYTSVYIFTQCKYRITTENIIIW